MTLGWLRSWFVALLLTVLFAPWTSLAATGETCVIADAAHYNKVSADDKCVMICDGVSQAGAQTSCGPIYVPEQTGLTAVIVAIEKAQAACITSTDIKVQESNSSTAGAPNVWTTLCTLTGVLDPLVQSCTPPRTPKGALRVTFTALADLDCTDVDVTATFKYSAPPR